MSLSHDSPCRIRAIHPCCPEKLLTPWWGILISDSDSVGGYQNLKETPKGWGMRFLRALFPKKTTPPTRNSERSLRLFINNQITSTFLVKLF